MADAPSGVGWSSSAAVPAAGAGRGIRAPEASAVTSATAAVLQLHTARFVNGRGFAATEEFIEQRRREGAKATLELKKGHLDWLRSVNEARDLKLKQACQHGAMSVRSKAEWEKIEQKRTDHRETSVQSRRDHERLARTCRDEARRGRHTTAAEEGGAESPRVPFNIRTQEELERLQRPRKEDHVEQRFRGQQRRWKEQKAAIEEAVAASLQKTFWTDDESARLDRVRAEAKELGAKHMEEVQAWQRTWKEEKESIASRQAAATALSFRTKEELDLLREQQQASMTSQQTLAEDVAQRKRAFKKDLKAIAARIGASPKKSFWTDEEKQRIESARTSSEEAVTRTANRARELEREYRKQLKSIDERVSGIPNKTFRTAKERDLQRHTDELRSNQHAKIARDWKLA
mmetsp:Transcript_77665/g.154082  ORF Transcript_77665/g.154082 Transcript_77665/m.154082 type:complete len:404 (+) Transcript_77665:86-1297(+)